MGRCSRCGVEGIGTGVCTSCNWNATMMNSFQAYEPMVSSINSGINDALYSAVSSGFKALANLISGSKQKAPTASSSASPKSSISLDIDAQPGTPAYNAAVVILYTNVYNSADKVLLRAFTEKYFAADYTSLLGEKPGSNSREHAYKNICAGMDKQWTMIDVKFTELTETVASYTYTLAYPSGTVPCFCSMVLENGVLISGAYKSLKK